MTTNHHNGLTETQAERLALLAEEKIVRYLHHAEVPEDAA